MLKDIQGTLYCTGSMLKRHALAEDSNSFVSLDQNLLVFSLATTLDISKSNRKTGKRREKREGAVGRYYAPH